MTEENLSYLVGSVGFPIAVASYLLVVFNNTMKDLTKAINDLRSTVGQDKKKEN